MDEVMPSEALNKEYVRSVTANKGVQVKTNKQGSPGENKAEKTNMNSFPLEMHKLYARARI